MAPARGGDPVRLTRDLASSDSAPRWSPDGRWLAFLSDRGGTRQVWRLDRRGGEPEMLTDLPGLFTADPRENPDAQLIHEVDVIDEKLLALAGGSRSGLGVGGMATISAKQTIRALQAPANLTKLVSLSPGAAILFVERVSYSQYDLPFEFLRIYYRGDRYELHNDLQG